MITFNYELKAFQGYHILLKINMLSRVGEKGMESERMQRVGTCIVLTLPWGTCSACEGMCVKGGEHRERLGSSIALWNGTDSDPNTK